jgi:hypothetical protein
MSYCKEEIIMSDLNREELIRLRRIYSLRDIQLALSAAEFLAECDPEKAISRAELNRFKCYETTMVVSYLRPFSQSRGGVPKLTLELCGPSLRDDLLLMHQRIRDARDKVFAHSDASFMRVRVKPVALNISSRDVTLFDAKFDEGLQFLGMDVLTAIDLFRTVYFNLYSILHSEVSLNPELFHIRKDYLEYLPNPEAL